MGFTQNYTTVNGLEVNSSLKVLVVGAGIGGLAAAIALRHQGHHIEVGVNGEQQNDAYKDRFMNLVDLLRKLEPPYI